MLPQLGDVPAQVRRHTDRHRGEALLLEAVHVAHVPDTVANADTQQAAPSADLLAQPSKMSRLQSLRQLKQRYGERTVRRQQLAVLTKASAAASHTSVDEPATPTPVHHL